MRYKQTDQIFHCGSFERKGRGNNACKRPRFNKRRNKNIKEVQQIPNIINSKTNTPRHFSQFLETERKKRVLQSAREMTYHIQEIIKIL